MFELLLQATEGEVDPGSIYQTGKITFVPVPADKADDDCYSAKMCPQPVELILEGITELLPDPKRKRRSAVQFKRMAFVIAIMPRPREHRAAPRREGGARAGSSASDDGGGGGDPPSRHKPAYGPRAESSPQSVSRAPRVQHGRARQ